MNELVNFLDHRLLPKVQCDSPSMDNFEPENLLSSNESIKNRGFIAYTVIKPPVSLTFEFLCPVDISSISLITTIGLQKCTGIEIFLRDSTSPDFTSVAKAFYEKKGVVFCNSRRYSKSHPPSYFDPQEQELFFFKRDTWRLFTRAEAMKLVIFRTARCVPCLQSIRVLGNVARCCTETTRTTVGKLLREKQEESVMPIETSIRNEEGIPEDFTDDLTCEIMALPMTLPSGKTIDRDTLEKHVENEKSFGRKPGDPFTGLKFTDTRKPILNIALKSRIDLFMLQHSDNPKTFGVKRTLGSSAENKSKKFKLSSQKCSACENDEVLYKLPCDDIFCRSCLINLKLKCTNCNQVFLRKDVERCNFR